MHADTEDMPEHLKSKKQEGPWRLVAIMGVGTAIVWGAITLFGKGFIDNANSIKDGQGLTPDIGLTRTAPKGEGERTESVRQEGYYQQPRVQGVDEVVIRDNNEGEEGGTPDQRKQTTFNDRNYRPTGAVNVVSFNQEAYEDSTRVAPIQKQKKIVVIGKQNRTEDWVCSYSGGEGSIRKRDCKARFQLENRNNGR